MDVITRVGVIRSVMFQLSYELDDRISISNRRKVSRPDRHLIQWIRRSVSLGV